MEQSPISQSRPQSLNILSLIEFTGNKPNMESVKGAFHDSSGIWSNCVAALWAHFILRTAESDGHRQWVREPLLLFDNNSSTRLLAWSNRVLFHDCYVFLRSFGILHLTSAWCKILVVQKTNPGICARAKHSKARLTLPRMLLRFSVRIP